MGITIKEMETDAEIKGKAYVHWKSWQEAYSGIVEHQYLDERTLEACEQMAHRWTKNTLIAKDQDRVVGFVQYGKNDDGDLQNAGEIIALYVLADHYGQGIGYQLTQEAMKHLRDYSKVAVWVFKANQRAITFYERNGFHFDGHQGVTQVGAPAARMILENWEGQHANDRIPRDDQWDPGDGALQPKGRR